MPIELMIALVIGVAAVAWNLLSLIREHARATRRGADRAVDWTKEAARLERERGRRRALAEWLRGRADDSTAGRRFREIADILERS